MATVDELVVELSGDIKKLKKSINDANKIVGGYEKDVTNSNKVISNSFKKAGSSVKSILGPLAAAASAYAVLDKLVSEGRSFAIMSAQLETATGSAEAAAKEFDRLVQFAAETPFLLQQSVDAFTKLTNLGLEPSQRAMMSYGNTASAMGKDLTQMIEAVADASTGEFERLKDFGITAKSEGDKVSFTFRKMTTTIGKNAAEIEEYLMSLGETHFSTAMIARMATLDGAISNFQDTWDALFRNVLASGVGQLIEDGFRGATSALQEFMEFTGIAKEAPLVFDETADAAIRYAVAQENLAQLAVDSTGKEAALLDVVNKIKDARDRAIEKQTKNVESEIALDIIRASINKRYQKQINAASEAVAANSKVNSELRQKEITQLNEAKAAIDAYVAVHQQEFETAKPPPPPLEVVFDEGIGAESFDKRIDMLQAHLSLVQDIISEHHRLIAAEDVASFNLMDDLRDEARSKELADQRAHTQSLLNSASSFLASMGSLVNAETKKSFERKKKWQYAETLVSTYASAQAAYYSAISSGAGQYAAVIAAGAAVAAGLGRLKQISRTEFGSKSAPTSTAGGGGAISAGTTAQASSGSQQQTQIAAQQAPTPIYNLTFQLGDKTLATAVVEGNRIAQDNDLQIFETEEGFERVLVKGVA